MIYKIFTIIIFISTGLSAMNLKDSGWVDFGKTARTEQYNKREIKIISSAMGETGLIYIHKKGEPTRGGKSTYLPFGIDTYQRNWRRSSLFDITVNGESQFISKNISAVPKYEYIEQGLDHFNLKITFPCGPKGDVNVFIKVAKRQNYFDFTFDLSQLKIEIDDWKIDINSQPSHSGMIREKGKQVNVPLNRMFKTVNRTETHKNKSTLLANENWVLLYDRNPIYGSCAVLFDPKSIEARNISGERSVQVSLSVKKGVKTIRCFLWEFMENKYSIDSAYAYLEQNSTQLLKELRTKDRNSNKSYKAVQVVKRPALDGASNNSSWDKVKWSSEFIDIKRDEKSLNSTKFKVAYDKNNLYLLIRCNERFPQEIVAKEREHDNNNIFRDDSIEIFISPQNSAINYLQMVFNTLGTKWDAIVFSKTQKSNKSWNPKWDVMVTHDKTGWNAEVEIPFTSLLLTSDAGEEWMLNIARNNMAGIAKPGHSKHLTWSRLDEKFNNPDNFNILTGIDEDLHHAYQNDKFDEYGMKAIKRKTGIKVGLEIVEAGSEKAFFYYPTKELYLPANGTVLRTLFDFEDTREETRKMMRNRRDLSTIKNYIKDLSFHILLPEGVTSATDMATIYRGIYEVERRSARHIVLHPKWPGDYGAKTIWPNLSYIPIYLKHSLKVGQRVPVDTWMEHKSPAIKTCVIRSYINIVEFPWVKTMPEKLSANRLWTYYNDIRTFPDYVKTSKALGFTGIPFFVGHFLYDGGQNNRKYDKSHVDSMQKHLIQIAAEARRNKMKIYLMDTTFNKVGFNKDTQWGKIQASMPLGDPTYRGPHYWSDIADVSTAYTMLGGADRISMDIECFKGVTKEHFGYFDKSKKDAERIRAMAKKKGTSVEDIFTDYGTEMMADLQEALAKTNKKLGIRKDPVLMIWGTCADEGNPMEGLYDYKKLYPKYNKLLNPHVYFESDPRKIGNRIKTHRRVLKNNGFIACLTMRWKRNDLAYTELRDQILECFYNGAGGIDYWPLAFDQNDAYGQLLALKEIIPFESIICNGKFICQTADESPSQIVGFVYKNESVLLVSNYQEGDMKIEIANPLKQDINVYSVSNNKSLGEVKQNAKFFITLDKRRTSVIYLGNKYGK